MQTWLPDEDFIKSAKALRTKELGRQRVDAKMALNALLYPERESKWRFHPVCWMWKGYERLLMKYYDAVVREWKQRGHKHTMEFDNQTWYRLRKSYLRTPWWMGQPEFHVAQQAHLIRRFGDHYEKQFPSAWETPVVWPVTRRGEKNKHLRPYGEEPLSTLPF